MSRVNLTGAALVKVRQQALEQTLLRTSVHGRTWAEQAVRDAAILEAYLLSGAPTPAKPVPAKPVPPKRAR